MKAPLFRITFFLLMYLSFSPTVMAQVVDIPDPNLRAAVENALGKAAGAPITIDDMANLIRLAAVNANISDLSGLENATNLTQLSLSGNSISDISTVAELTDLTQLNLARNPLSDISAVAGLTNLTRLYLSYSPLSDISAVAGLTNLTVLGLGFNNISDISAVAGLTNLTQLSLQHNSISDISALAGLTKLTRLNLRENQISDISALAELTDLTVLYLDNNQISDISAVAGLTKLRELELWSNSISDISALAGLTNLTVLYLTDNQISDISAVAGLTKLKELTLRDNNISDISALVANTGLRYGDKVNVLGNPLSYLSLPIHTHVPTLQSRGLAIEFEDRTHLNVGEPHTVRLIYFLPSDRQSQPDIDTQMGALIKEVQQSYANDMEHHGFGRKTFVFETDATGKAVVHHIVGQFTAEHYKQGTFSKVVGEIGEQFDIRTNIYLVVVDSGYLIDGAFGKASLGGGAALTHDVGHVYTASHELRHTFGLQHDFRISARGFTFEISKCTAEFLDVHPYFNASRQNPNISRGTIEMLPPSLAAPPNAIRLRFEVTDADGLHHARLSAPEVDISGGHTGGFIACKRLTGTSSIVEFVTTVLIPENNEVFLHIVDIHGNITASKHAIRLTSLLPHPEVALMPDANLAAAVRETLGLSPRATLTTRTMLNLMTLYASNRQITDLTGLEHAHNLKLLSLGSEDASGSSVNSNEVSNFSPLEGLTQLTWLQLIDNNISDISTLAGLTSLEVLFLNTNSIRDISALAGLTNLTELRLNNNLIRDISALAGLTNLTQLELRTNSIRDISALAGLTNLTELHLYTNSIRDISALAGLTNLNRLLLTRNSITDLSPLVANAGLGQGDSVNVLNNPMSYQSIHTHIPALQNRGVGISFDNRAHPAILKISGDNQKDVSFAPLSQPFVVEVQDEKGVVSEGVSVKFAVTAGSGIVRPEIVTTDENGRAQSTLILGPNLGANAVEVSATGIHGAVIFHATSDYLPTEHLWSIPRGVSLIHVPLKVRTIDDVAQTITSVSDLYDALDGANTVNFLITYDAVTQGWLNYFGTADKDTSADKVLIDDRGVIAGMKVPVSLRLRGDALGANGNSTITLHPGMNLVGVPLRDSRIARVSDLFALEGIRGNVSIIKVVNDGRFRTVKQGGDAGDIFITGGESFILTARETTTVAISGGAWYNTSEMATVLPPTIGSIEVGDATPVLVLRGSIADEGAGVNKEDFSVTVKNLSTDRVTTTIIGNENFSLPNQRQLKGVEYQIAIVDTVTGRAARIGDILEISAQSPESLIGVRLLQHVVTAEDVLQSRIELGALVIYEILWETDLLQNYPNPFTPETWIPYRLGEDAVVIFTIYDLSGRLVRTLDVGHRIAEIYESESKAIYWDGRNNLGERVASGIYFYTLIAGDYSATRKMVIVK